MPICKNDPTKTYIGKEPSPKGLGWCAASEKENVIRKGKDGNKWVAKRVKNGSLRWFKYTEMSMITVSYKSISSGIFPNYRMVGFPKTWKYDGSEGALNTQPLWQTDNAYFYGPSKDAESAKKKYKTLYEKYRDG